MMPSAGSPDQLTTAAIERTLRESIAVKEQLCQEPHLTRIAQAVELFVAALRAGRKILLFGNGGSAADAQHIAAELVGRFMAERPSWPALGLTAKTSTLTAIGNDYGYEQTFSRQVEGLGKPG